MKREQGKKNPQKSKKGSVLDASDGGGEIKDTERGRESKLNSFGERRRRKFGKKGWRGSPGEGTANVWGKGDQCTKCGERVGGAVGGTGPGGGQTKGGTETRPGLNKGGTRSVRPGGKGTRRRGGGEIRVMMWGYKNGEKKGNIRGLTGLDQKKKGGVAGWSEPQKMEKLLPGGKKGEKI